MGCLEYFTIVYIWYEDSFTQMKRWNAHEVTQSSCSCVYVLIEMSRVLQCVCAKGKRVSAIHSYRDMIV